MPMLGVWMWPESVEKRGARETVSRCVKIGVTDIFFLAKGLSGLVPITAASRRAVRNGTC